MPCFGRRIVESPVSDEPSRGNSICLTLRRRVRGLASFAGTSDGCGATMATYVSSLAPSSAAATCPILTDVRYAGFAKRMLFLGLGILFLMLAIAGVLLPGVPTTGPLIAASFFLTKSCPRLEQRLIRNRFFARYMQYLDGRSVMTDQVRFKAIVAMWTSILISGMVVLLTAGAAPLFILGMVCGGSVGTICIWKFRRPAQQPSLR